MITAIKKYFNSTISPLDDIKLERPLFDFGDSGQGSLNLFNESFSSEFEKYQKPFNPDSFLRSRYMFSQFFLRSEAKPGKIKLSEVNGITASKLHGKDLTDFESFNDLSNYFHTDWYVPEKYQGYKAGYLEKNFSRDRDLFDNEIDWEMNKITKHHFSECGGNYYYKAYSNELIYGNSGTSHRFTMLCHLDKKNGLGRYIDGDISIERINRQWCSQMLKYYKGYIFSVPGPETQSQILQHLFLGKCDFKFIELHNPRKYFQQFLILVPAATKFDSRTTAWVDKNIESHMILSFGKLVQELIDFEDSQNIINQQNVKYSLC